jgi:hypothetical protein
MRGEGGGEHCAWVEVPWGGCIGPSRVGNTESERWAAVGRHAHVVRDRVGKKGWHT